jgi:hypothetical protein
MTRIYVVDRREGDVLVMVDDDDHAVDVSRRTLPKTCRAEGAVLRVPLDTDGSPIWANARRDRIEERRRLSELSKRLERLRRADPGGDVVL